jgi:protein-disulfide isomerase
MPDFKSQYVDTGKARYILRHFVANGADIAASMIARCGGGGDVKKYHGYINLFLGRQDAWIKGWQEIGTPPQDATLASLAVMAKMDLFVRPTGMARSKMEACLNDKALETGLLKMREEGVRQFGVNQTPSVYINGKRYMGDLSFEAFEQALKKAL